VWAEQILWATITKKVWAKKFKNKLMGQPAIVTTRNLLIHDGFPVTSIQTITGRRNP
jgi:hypothetical protein